VAGKAGRSGRKPMTVLEHRLRGTFRADRHGSLAAVSALPGGWQPSDAEASGLGDVGRQFVTRIAGGWLVTDAQGPLVLLAGRTLDELAAYDQCIAADGVIVVSETTGKPKPHPVLRARNQAARLFALVIKQLELK
jgi:hypothetical protein